MTIDERSRHQRYRKLEQVLGSEEADTLMGHLPPVGWADVATKRDLKSLKNELLATFRAELSSSQWRVISGVLASNLSLAGLAFAAARLI